MLAFYRLKKSFILDSVFDNQSTMKWLLSIDQALCDSYTCFFLFFFNTYFIDGEPKKAGFQSAQYHVRSKFSGPNRNLAEISPGLPEHVTR